MTRKRSSKKATPAEIAKAGVAAILFLALTYISIMTFYILLTIGVLMLIGPFFMPSDDRWVIVTIGAALIAAAFIGNIVLNRLSMGKWKFTWPSTPGGL